MNKFFSMVRVIALILVFAFIVGGCAPKAVFKNPEAAAESVLAQGDDVKGLTIAFKPNLTEEMHNNLPATGPITEENYVFLYEGQYSRGLVIIALLKSDATYKNGKSYVMQITGLTKIYGNLIFTGTLVEKD